MFPWLRVRLNRIKNHSTSSPGGSDDVTTKKPSINALPAEIFLEILLQTLDPETTFFYQLHKLAQVCTYWLQSIISDSRFWRVIDLNHRGLTPVVLRRNPSGPLTVLCHWMGWENPSGDFMEVARSQANRWEALEISGELRGGSLQAFDVPTPTLVTLRVTSSCDRRRITPKFPLSSSSTLRHVAVSGIQLPWDSADFSGLRSLSIHASYPSLGQIVTTLSATSSLEWLSLGEIPPFGYRVDDTDVPEQTISLPALRGLYLQRDIASSITHHLLTTIDGPQCCHLEAPITFQLLEDPGPTFGKLASIPVRAASCLIVDCHGGYMTVDICSFTLPHIYRRDGWRRERDGASVSISLGKMPYSSPNALEFAINALSLDINHVEVILRIQSWAWSAEAARLPRNHPAIWESATHIHFSSNYGSQETIADLQFLATPVIKNGRAKWSCPRLTRIHLADFPEKETIEIAHAILRFLEKRSTAWVRGGSSATGADIAWDTPAPFESIKAKQGMLRLIRGAKVAKGVQLVVDDRLW